MAERRSRMRFSISRLWLAGALVLLTGVGCTPMDDALAAIFGRSMRVQPNFNPYEDPQGSPEGSVSFASGNFPAADGVVNLGQPEGTPIPAPITPFQLLQARTAPADFPQVTGLVNPVPPDAGSLARGEELFQRSCVPCHGPSGLGDGLVTAAGVPVRSILEAETTALTDGHLYSIIRVGQGAMPAYGHQITHYDRWHVVNYVRQLQGQLPGQTQPESETEPGPPEN